RRTSVDLLKKASPFGDMLEAVRRKAESLQLWDDEMQRDLPKKWEKHGDMIIFPQHSFTHQNWKYIGREVWKVVAESLKVARLGRKRVIDERTPHVDLLYGSDGWVEHVDERKIRYIYDASKRVFNIEKAKEMKRISEFDCHGETVVDMYAGLGYFTFPFAIACKAKKVYAIDWDEDTVEALVRSCSANEVDDVVEIIQGDARRMCPQGIADRVYLGLVPSCHAHLLTAARALSPQGGIVHVQESIDTKVPRVIPKRKPMLKSASKLESVDESGVTPSTSGQKEEMISEIAHSDSTPAVIEENGEVDEEGKPRLRRKFSRSASIVQEMENRKMPEALIHPEFQDKWMKAVQQHKDFALECANCMTRFLNNIHESEDMYTVSVVGIHRLASNKTVDTIVLELVCAKDIATVDRLSSKLLKREENAKKE
ncbi:hypothetical protein PFISCL1PPCAC_2055, partial [Pristionchus fissidentatus]